MALIGNPMDFDRIRQRYESLVYPQGRTLPDNNFNRVRDSYTGLLGQPTTDPLTGQPINMGVLTGSGSTVMSQDATAPGQQVQLRFNPVTGQTETIIPEYMGEFRTDQQDFFPSSEGSFQTIYDTGQGSIDPTTGRPTPTSLISDPVSGQTMSALPMRGRGEGGNRDIGATSERYDYVGGKFVGSESLNEDGTIKYGIHGSIPGIFGLPAQIARFTPPSTQLNTLQNISEMNMAYSGIEGNRTGAASDIARLANTIRQQAQDILL